MYYGKTTNKKVRNATVCRADGIEFKSKLEMFCYLYFKSENLMLKYEQDHTVIMHGFNTGDKVNVWIRRKTTGSNEYHLRKSKAFLDMVYTPDFSLMAGEDIFYIETKGMANDAYPLRRKMFIANLVKQADELGCRFHFFEPHTKAEVIETCEIIKSIMNQNGKETN